MSEAILASFNALPFEEKIALVSLAKTRVTQRGAHGLSMVRTREVLALAWFADLWLDDHPDILAVEPPADPGTTPDTKGTEL